MSNLLVRYQIDFFLPTSSLPEINQWKNRHSSNWKLLFTPPYVEVLYVHYCLSTCNLFIIPAYSINYFEVFVTKQSAVITTPSTLGMAGNFFFKLTRSSTVFLLWRRKIIYCSNAWVLFYCSNAWVLFYCSNARVLFY